VQNVSPLIHHFKTEVRLIFVIIHKPRDAGGFWTRKRKRAVLLKSKSVAWWIS